jgi:hypothetical protein
MGKEKTGANPFRADRVGADAALPRSGALASPDLESIVADGAAFGKEGE